MLCEQVLGKLHDFDTTGKTIEYVDIEWHEAFKKIHKKITDVYKRQSLCIDKRIHPCCYHGRESTQKVNHQIGIRINQSII